MSAQSLFCGFFSGGTTLNLISLDNSLQTLALQSTQSDGETTVLTLHLISESRCLLSVRFPLVLEI